MERLSRNEMKRIMGGVAPTGGTCQAQVPSEFGILVPTGGLSAADAKTTATAYGTHYCCDSCCTATWADHTGCPPPPAS